MFYWHSLLGSAETSERVCIIWTMDSGFCMFISFVMDKVFTKQVANK